jgi:nicotinate-nucleotide adenylyltransferase
VRVGVFGGSFDPIHHGHLVVARAVGEALGLDQVLLVPAAQQPLKVGGHGAGAVHRLEMVRVAVEADAWFRVEPLEVVAGGPSYTVDTLRALVARAPEHRLHLLVGSDAARLLPAWKEPDAVRALADLVVFRREGDDRPLPADARIVAVPRIDISSTDVRERVRRGRPVRYWVPDAVDAYIRTNSLYREA